MLKLQLTAGTRTEEESSMYILLNKVHVYTVEESSNRSSWGE